MVISWFYIYIKASCGSTFSLREEQSRMILLSMALIGSYLNQPSCLSPFTHIRGKKTKTKNEHLKSAVAFHFLMSVESARLGSDQLLLARQSNASTTATESRCWLKGRNSEREKTSVCCRGQRGDRRPWLNREREKYVNVQGRFNTDGRI